MPGDRRRFTAESGLSSETRVGTVVGIQRQPETSEGEGAGGGAAEDASEGAEEEDGSMDVEPAAGLAALWERKAKKQKREERPWEQWAFKDLRRVLEKEHVSPPLPGSPCPSLAPLWSPFGLPLACL